MLFVFIFLNRIVYDQFPKHEGAPGTHKRKAVEELPSGVGLYREMPQHQYGFRVNDPIPFNTAPTMTSSESLDYSTFLKTLRYDSRQSEVAVKNKPMVRRTSFPQLTHEGPL